MLLHVRGFIPCYVCAPAIANAALLSHRIAVPGLVLRVVVDGGGGGNPAAVVPLSPSAMASGMSGAAAYLTNAHIILVTKGMILNRRLPQSSQRVFSTGSSSRALRRPQR